MKSILRTSKIQTQNEHDQSKNEEEMWLVQKVLFLNKVTVTTKCYALESFISNFTNLSICIFLFFLSNTTIAVISIIFNNLFLIHEDAKAGCLSVSSLVLTG